MQTRKFPAPGLCPLGHRMSDHIPLMHILLSTALPLVPWTQQEKQEDAVSLCLRIPVCQSQLADAKAAVHIYISATCDVEAGKIHKVLGNAFSRMNGDHPAANISNNSEALVDELRSMGDMQAVYWTVQKLLKQAMPILLQHCDTTRVNKGGSRRHLMRHIFKQTKWAHNITCTLRIACIHIMKLMRSNMLAQAFKQHLTNVFETSELTT